MQQKVTFQNSHGHKLAGVLHIPDKQGRFPAIIRIHGFMSNKDGKSSTTFAQEFKNDYVYLRFDLAGHGESQGEFDDLTMTRCIDDTKAAINFISKQEKIDKERIGIIGSSLGGAVAIYITANNPNIRAAVFLAPVSDWKKNFNKEKWSPKKWEKTGERFFENRDTGKKKRLKYDYYKDAVSYNLYQEAEKIKVPTLIIQGTQDKSIPMETTTELVKHLSNPHLEIIEDADHNFREPEHFKQMIQKSVEFFKQNL